MILFKDIDGDKAVVFLQYLGTSTRKVFDLDEVRTRLNRQLDSIHTTETRKMQSRLHEAESTLQKALAKEKSLLQERQADEMAIEDVQHKIDMVLTKLDRVLDAPDGRVEELYQKVDEHAKPRLEKIKLLKKSLRDMQRIHQEIPNSARYRGRLETIEKRMKAIKSQLRKLK